MTSKIALMNHYISYLSETLYSNLQCFSLPKRVYWYQLTLLGNLKTGGDPIILTSTLSTLYQLIFLPCPCHERIKVQKLYNHHSEFSLRLIFVLLLLILQSKTVVKVNSFQIKTLGKEYHKNYGSEG